MKIHMGRTELCQLTGHSLSSGKAKAGTPGRSQVGHKAKTVGESGFWFALPGSLSYLSDTVQGGGDATHSRMDPPTSIINQVSSC